MTISILGPAKLSALLRIASEVESLPGSAAEFGVYHGGTLAALARTCPHRRVYGFDTFEGLPAEMWREGEPHSVGDFSDCTLAEAQAAIADTTNAVLVPGLFPDSAARLAHERFAVAHLDFDYHKSTRAALEWLLPRMVPGGAIVFDDYDWVNCPGVNAHD